MLRSHDGLSKLIRSNKELSRFQHATDVNLQTVRWRLALSNLDDVVVLSSFIEEEKKSSPSGLLQILVAEVSLKLEKVFTSTIKSSISGT